MLLTGHGFPELSLEALNCHLIYHLTAVIKCKHKLTRLVAL